MRGAYRDIHAGFSDFEAAEAVDQGDAMDGKVIVEIRGDLLDFGESHGLVCFVLEVEGAAVFGMVADESVKDNHGAIPVAANISRESDWVYSFLNQRCNVGGGGGHGYTSATAYRRQEGNFIASMKNGIPRRELLIAGGDQGRAILLKFGVSVGVAGKKRFDVGVDRQVYGFVGASGDLFKAAEK